MIYRKYTLGISGIEMIKQISKEDALKLTNMNTLTFDTEEEAEAFKLEFEKLHGKIQEDTIKVQFTSPNSKGFNCVFGNKKETISDSPKRRAILQSLQFLDEEDLHDIVLSLFEENNTKAKELLTYIYPSELASVLEEDDVDYFFKKCLETNANIDIQQIIPYVSEEALSSFVDEYIKGNYKNVDINFIYPYLSSKDIKRLFDYYLISKESE